MKENKYEKLLIPEADDSVWALYHENSKQNPWYRVKINDGQIESYFEQTHLSLPYESEFIRKIEFSDNTLKMSLSKAIQNRKSSGEMIKSQMSFEEISTLLFAGFGITRPNEKPRPLRSVPSGGKLFPLEPYCYIANNKELPTGLYHFNSEQNHIALLKQGQHEYVISDAMVQSDLANKASMIIFISAIFRRSTIKYGEKAYRLILLEAGHAAQNINLAAAAMGLACRNVSAFYDRRIESYLGIDGIDQSILYMIVLGRNDE